MNRTIVEISKIEENDQARILFRLHEPRKISKARIFRTWPCTPGDAPFVQMSQGVLALEAVKQAGDLLWQNLYKHEAVRSAIEHVLARDKDIAPVYLYLNEGAGDAEELPWETLYSPHAGFLALDQRWQIGRMSDVGAPDAVLERTFALPLRITAFLSATGIDARPEWEALYSALHKSEIRIDLQVYVCQPDLKTHIEGVQDPNVHIGVAFVPGQFDFTDLIPDPDRAPHILHFFCHGSDNANLQLATISDWLAQTSSVIIGPKDFQNIPALARDHHLWLVTLNCCQGAAALTDQEAQSFTRLLVNSYHIPAVIGMREAVTTNDAHVFCKEFYTALLAEIKQCLKAVQEPVEIEWAKALYKPRWSICKTHGQGQALLKAAATSKEWTLPVLYARPETFKLRVISTQSLLSEHERDLRSAELAQLRAALTMLPVLTPAGAINEIKQRIATLEVELFPQ